MWGSFVFEGSSRRFQLEVTLKHLAECFRKLAVTQMVKARCLKGQRAVRS
jgi:hypothetical protein